MPVYLQADVTGGYLRPVGDKDVKCQPYVKSDSRPIAYFITFRTYGTWLPGGARGYVHRTQNSWSAPYLTPCPDFHRLSKDALRHAPVVLRDEQRIVVHLAIVETCYILGWTVHATNVRSNHVHVVVAAPCKPERVMHALKAWSTRRMVESGLWAPGEKVWVRHGSTRYLWTPLSLSRACDYVVEGQGD